MSHLALLLELNVVETLPPNFEASGRKRYPLLLNPYGGPGSQSVDHKFVRDWHHYLVCEKGIIVLTVDNRGTGFKGRGFRNWVRDRLGLYEVSDQVNVARMWAKEKYIDTKKIGIWGWVRAVVSFGRRWILILPYSTELRRILVEQSDRIGFRHLYAWQ